MNKWISVEDRPPEGECLVYVAKDITGSRIHAGSFSYNAKTNRGIDIIGGHFRFDMPTVTHWMPLPEPPKE